LNYDKLHITDWLPTTKKQAKQRGWNKVDVVLFSGDAYVDHPSFGAAVIGRILEKEGLRVAIVPQPNWRDDLRDFKKFGQPHMFFAVTAGNMDSMTNHYTANKRLRSDDAYTPGGTTGFRPDYASTVYATILKRVFPDVPVVMGGVEASLRRLVHYDYWADQLKPGILVDSKADLLVYGMGELPLKEIVRLLKKGVPFVSLKNIPGTAYLVNKGDILPKVRKWNDIALTSLEGCVEDRKQHAINFKFIEEASNRRTPDSRLIQEAGGKTIVVNPHFPVMSEKEIDASFNLPYTRLPHPKYKKRGPIPAYEMIRHSINIHRGCFGGCSFCSISAHQGKFIASRSEGSILKEVEQITKMPDFRGYISDIGGPSANMYKMRGKDLEKCQRCKRPSCTYPAICNKLDIDHSPLNTLYEKIRSIKGVKKAFIGSGVRYDLFLNKKHRGDPDKKLYFENLVRHHVAGRLKVAPEHTEDAVLKIMRKPTFDLFYDLKKKFDSLNKKHNLNQQLIPYLISSHPGCDKRDMVRLAEKVNKLYIKLEQVQDFTPTPMTVATVIYYSGYHPVSLEKVYTATTKEEKLKQRSYFNKDNLVKKRSLTFE
jgi:uncharacterized radical SAM protein YgiQ